MRLSEILKDVEVIGTYSDVEITGIVSDSRRVTKGAAFVCIKGASFDGHSAAKQALESGAAVVVAERDTGVPSQVIVRNTREACALMAAAYYGYPASKMKLIGITGTNGKTTTTYLIKGLLEQFGKKVGLIGTVHNLIGNEVIPERAHFTTPEAIDLQADLARMVEAGCEYCVMEASSIALCEGRLIGCHFDIGIFSNLTQDHLDYHRTMESYLLAKRMLFESSDTAIINYDDPYAERITEGTDCRIITYSAESNDADYMAKNLILHSDAVRFELVGNDDIARVSLGIPGKFSVYNALAAAVTMVTLGFPMVTVAEDFAKLSGVVGRMEIIPTGLDFTVMIDFAHTPDALEKLLETVREIVKGRLIVVFGCPGKRDVTKRPIMGRIAGEYCDLVIITSDNPSGDDPVEIINEIVSGVKPTGTSYLTFVDRREAIEYAMANAAAGDMVALAGKGHETYQIVENGEYMPFNEHEIVAEIAGRMKAAQ